MIGVFVREHCPPHATCRDQNRTWTVRIGFSFIDDTTTLKDIMPVTAQVPGYVLDRLKEIVGGNLAAYRAQWWKYQNASPANQAQGACCLNNQIILGQRVQQATFDPATGKTSVALSNGTTYIHPP